MRDHRFSPRVVGIVKLWKDFLSGHGILSSRGSAAFFLEPQSISDEPVGLGFHTVRGGFDPSDHCLGPRFAGIVEIWTDF